LVNHDGLLLLKHAFCFDYLKKDQNESNFYSLWNILLLIFSIHKFLNVLNFPSLTNLAVQIFVKLSLFDFHIHPFESLILNSLAVYQSLQQMTRFYFLLTYYLLHTFLKIDQILASQIFLF
jgi:hypothetical protein